MQQIFTILLLIGCFALAAQPVRTWKTGKATTSEKRLALVMGNSAYQHAPTLPNTRNDANDMAAVLQELGFDVILCLDADKNMFVKVVNEFGTNLKENGYTVGLVYYAGHAIEAYNLNSNQKQNYLMPVDANPTDVYEVEAQSVAANAILNKMKTAKVSIVLLDACRDNPFDQLNQSQTVASREWIGNGIGEIKAPAGIFIGFATHPNGVSSDGKGRNGTFTGALLNYIKTPNLSLSDIFAYTTGEVKNLTSGSQNPWQNGSLSAPFYFNTTTTTPAPASSSQQVTKLYGLENIWGKYDYEGATLNNIPHGYGRATFKNGNIVSYEGYFMMGHFSGQGTAAFSTGQKHVGEWKDDKTNGQGTRTYPNGEKYIGEEKDGKKHGQGTMTWASGEKYVGEWKDDKRNGQGTNTYATGNKYVGAFKDGERNGQGTNTWVDGQKYIGEWKDDKRNGQGTNTWASGQKYIGEFKDDERNGQGTNTWATGEKYIGAYKDDHRNGQGTDTYANGEKYIGEWKDGKKNGQGTMTYTTGEKYVGEWKDSKRNGQGKMYNPSGRLIYEGGWLNSDPTEKYPNR